MKIKIEYSMSDDGGSIVYGFLVGLTHAPVIFDHPKTVDLLHLGSDRRIVLIPELIAMYQRLRYVAGGYEVLSEGEPGWSAQLEQYVFEATKKALDGRIRGQIGPTLGDLPGTGPEYRPGEDRPGDANVTRFPVGRARDGEGGGS